MWVAYAKTEADARELELELIARREGPITWVAFAMAPTWVEVDRG